MPYLWLDDRDGFAALALTETLYSIVAPMNGSGSLMVSAGLRSDRSAVLARVTPNGSAVRWAVVSKGGGLEVNGVPLPSGIRVLRDRDAVRFDSEQLAFFSAETAPQIEPFPGNEPVSCARCYSLIQPGDNAVCCPLCNVWHHQISGAEGEQHWECWTHHATCGQCQRQPTDSQAGPTWTPEDL
jgi:hypothetical protein